MKNFIIFVGALGLVSCTSSNKTGNQETDAVIAHLAKGPVVVGKDWDEKFTKDGIIGDELVAIGSKKDSSNMKEETMKVFAETDGTSKLLSSAPTEFKKIVQKALSTVTGEDSVDVNSFSVTEVKALTGMKTQFSDSHCVKMATPTMDLKYGVAQQSDIQKKVKEEMIKEMFNNSAEKQVSN